MKVDDELSGRTHEDVMETGRACGGGGSHQSDTEIKADSSKERNSV